MLKIDINKAHVKNALHILLSSVILSLAISCSIMPWYVIEDRNYRYLLYPWGYVQASSDNTYRKVTLELSALPSKLFLLALSLILALFIKTITNKGLIGLDTLALLFLSSILFLASAITFQNFMVYMILVLRGTCSLSYGILLAYALSFVLQTLALKLKASRRFSLLPNDIIKRMKKTIREGINEIYRENETLLLSSNLTDTDMSIQLNDSRCTSNSSS